MPNRILELAQQLGYTTGASPTAPRGVAQPRTSSRQGARPLGSGGRHGARGVRALSRPVDYRIPGIVPSLRQSDPKAAWATVTAMLVSWRENAAIPIETVMSRIGPRYVEVFRRRQGLSGAERPAFLAATGLAGEYPASLDAAGWETMLRDYGPLWVTPEEWPGPDRAIHSRVVVGVHGDGSDEGTVLDVVDPADGREHQEALTVFRQTFEDARGKGRERMQIVHWPRDAKFSVVRSLAVARALDEQAQRLLLTEEELAELEPEEPELGPPGARPMRASVFSVAAAAPQPLDAKDAKWADDALSPDYRHLGAAGMSVPFAIGDGVLERLCRLNSFALPKDQTRIVFGLRGCQIAGPVGGFAPEITLMEDMPNHIDNHCVIGVWNRGDRTVTAFPGSTVPNWRLMEVYRQTGKGSNMLPTGMYAYQANTHRKSKPNRVHGALVQADSRVILRTKDDLSYTVHDFWDHGQVGDNIHPALRKTNPPPSTDPDFSSAGCQTIPGFSKDDVPSGDWAAFRSALGFDNTRLTAANGTKLTYVLLTGREARLAAEGVDDASLTRLRFGSSGETVRALQRALKALKGNEKLGTDGEMGPKTVLAYIKWQQANDHGAADGIVTPATARALGVDILGGQPRGLARSVALRRASGALSGGGRARPVTAPAPAPSITIPLDPGVGGRSIGIEALEVGDIILSTTPDKVSEGIRDITGAEVSHSMLYVGDGDVVEAIGKGVVRRPLAQAIADASLAVAVRYPQLTPAQATQIRDVALSKLGSKYDGWALVDHAVRYVGRPDPKLRKADSFFCSELVLVAFDAAGIPLTTAPPDVSSPHDIVKVYLARSLEYVGHLKTQP